MVAVRPRSRCVVFFFFSRVFLRGCPPCVGYSTAEMVERVNPVFDLGESCLRPRSTNAHWYEYQRPPPPIHIDI